MAVEKMYLVNMISDKKNLDSFLEDVIKIGDIEPLDSFNQITNRNFNITASAENVDITEDINNLSGFDRNDDGFINKLEEMKNSLGIDSNSENGQLLDHERVDELYDKLKVLLDKKTELEEKSKQLEVYKKNVDLLKQYDIDIDKIQNLKYFDYRYGVVTEDGRFILKNNYENIPSLIIHLDENVDRASLNALDEIYAIDEATYNLNEKTNQVLENERENARNVSLKLDQEYSLKTKNESNQIYNDIMQGASDRENKINADYQSRINNMNDTYSKHKDEVVDKIVDFLVNSES
ncbi:hypothetical protein [Anaerococcus sp. mt242]|uniref:hypothetical protein n=1 Tax=unclassified Anaerococcus TaxID=2614126 RepID=UPI00193421A5|nr:hypothetical protein [Anaerococcus sp. mt242]MBM0046380.1 hypothetical protein [Anaerococcus sp. mt242]